MKRGIYPQIDEMLKMRYFSKSIYMFGNNRRVSSHQIGNHISHSKGRGVDFDEVRPYQLGDDIRLIHWSLTARLGKPFTKVYHEEKERATYVIVDQSRNMNFGTRVCFKNVLAANLASLFGWYALDQQEQIGGIIFNDNSAQLFKPSRTRQSLLNMLNILANQNKILPHYGSFLDSMRELSHKIATGSTIIIISDFNSFSPELEKYLGVINQKAKVINIMTYDPLEKSLPDTGSYTFTKTGSEQLKIDATDINREKYLATFNQRKNHIAEFSARNNMRFIEIATNDNWIETINHGVIAYGCK